MIRKRNFQFLVIVLFFLTNCKKEQVKEDCGCNGVIQFTIPNNEPLLGEIGFQEAAGQDSTGEFSFKYWASYTEKNCSNCIHYFIICNEEFIPQEIKTKISTYGVCDSVYFSGLATETCQKIFAPADYTYNHIILTKIEKK